MRKYFFPTVVTKQDADDDEFSHYSYLFSTFFSMLHDKHLEK